MQKIIDPWISGEPYARFMGRWSRLIAGVFIDWIAVPAGHSWLDLGCGTGALSRTIIETASPKRVISVDPTLAFLRHARQAIQDTRIRFSVGRAGALPVKAHSLDALVSGLVLNFVPDVDQALAEMKAVVRPDGVIAAYIWDYPEKMEMLRIFWDVVVELDPQARHLDEGSRFPLCRPDALQQCFTQAGFRGAEVRAIDVKAVYRDFDDYWLPFLGGQGPAAGYVAKLERRGQEKLAAHLRQRLPIAADGSIELNLRAWAVKARGCMA